MKLTRTTTDFYVYCDDFDGEVQGDLINEGTLVKIKISVFEMLKTTPLPSLPVAVEEVLMIAKPSETVLLIEIEPGKAYQIKPTFAAIKHFTTKKTWSGGLLNIIAHAEKLLN
jgi:hypothetical protein